MTIEITPEIIDLLEKVLTDPGLNIPDLSTRVPPTPPTVATIRELEIETSPTRIDAQYTVANYDVDVSDLGGISQVLRNIVTGALQVTEAPSMKLPFKTPLSLKNYKYSFVIIRLTGKNWQFSRDKAPFSIGLDSINKKRYFEARRVDENGGIVAPSETKDRCKIAFFISDGAAATSGTPTAYSDAFNIHLDLIYKDSDQNDSYMPIVLDPDVRYPGGSGVDGGP